MAFIEPMHRNKPNITYLLTQYVCDKSKKVWVCAIWQWNSLNWCYCIALPASLVVQSSKEV